MVDTAEMQTVDLWALDDASLLAGFEELLAAEARLRAEQIRWLRAIQARDATVAECGRATRSWLVEELGLSPREAGRRLRLGSQLSLAPATEQVLATGEIHAEHAETVARCVIEVPEVARVDVERALLELARHVDPRTVRRAVDEVRVRFGVDADEDEAARRRIAGRGVGLDVTFGGFGSLNGTLTPEVAESLRLAMESAGVKTGAEDTRSFAQRRHDALGEIADFYLAHSEGVTDSGLRPQVVVTLPLSLLTEVTDSVRAMLPGGQPLGAATARRLACDADLVPAVLGSAGEVLDLGRSTRVFNAAIRRAAWLRDGGRCAFGGCRRRPRELHHVIWWSKGGCTSLDNAAWLCAFHHWLVHEGGWSMRTEVDGYTFTSRHGREHRFHRQPRAG